MLPSFVQSEIVSAIGWTLLHSLWQGVLVGVVFTSSRGLIPKASSGARYANGLIALALLLFVPLATFFSLLNASAVTGGVVEASAVIESAPMVVAASAPTAPVQMALGWLVLLWIGGVVLAGYRSWCQWRSLVRIARDWAEPMTGLDEMLAQLATRFGLVRRRVRVLITDHVDTPILFGWFKPIILLPTAVALGFPRHQLELILAHELGHLRRYDHLVNLAQAFVETVLFYHPVVHWISREIRNEREICCDRLVLERTAGEPREYARTLAALEELRQPVQLALAASGGVLLDRVRLIVGAAQDGARNRSRLPWLLVIGSMAVALLVGLRVPVREPVDVAAIERLFERPVLADAVALDRFVATPVVLRLAEVSDSQGKPDITPPARPSLKEAPSAPAAAESEIVAAAAIQTAPSIVPVAVPQILAAQDVKPTSLPVAANVAPAVEPLAASTDQGSAPRPMHRVAPEYPDSGSDRVERVKLEFAISADGSVRGVRVTSRQPSSFARAAERALKQWRFGSGTFDTSRRYAQTFVFEPGADESDAGCVRRTGSKLCRRSIEPDTSLDDSSRIAAASGDSHHGS